MTKQRKPYKTYPKEFKLEALRLMNDSNRPASEIAMELEQELLVPFGGSKGTI